MSESEHVRLYQRYARLYNRNPGVANPKSQFLLKKYRLHFWSAQKLSAQRLELSAAVREAEYELSKLQVN